MRCHDPHFPSLFLYAASHDHIRDKVKRGEVKLEYYETTALLADIMAKGIHGPRHKDLTTALDIRARSD